MKKKMWVQRLFGVVMLLITFVIWYLAKTGDPTIPYDTDATAVLFTLPLGLWLLFTKQYVLSI